jgi:hypothetical protein
MKKYIKRALKSNAVQIILAAIVFLYLRLVFKTSRWEKYGFEHMEAANNNSQGCIFTFFHGRLAMMHYAKPKNIPFYMLLSDHSDGRFIARVNEHSKVKNVYGSSTRGGAKAMLQLIKLLKSGACIGVTPDGPKGPNQSVSEGVIQMARLANVPIVACSFSIRRHRRLNTWDRFMFPLPFSRGVFMMAPPITVIVDEAANVSHWQEVLRNTMLELQDKCDEWIKG